MTDYKDIEKRYKSRSLYFGLLRSILMGVILAVISFILVIVPSIIVIYEVYESREEKMLRREEYLADLQEFIDEGEIDSSGIDQISEWLRRNSYVYLAIYTKPTDTPLGSIPSNPESEDGYRVIEFVGANIDESLDSDDLFSAAVKNGYFLINLADVSMTLAINEYTEDLYYSTWGTIAFIVAGVAFLLSLVNYMRVIIERIKRFASDVTIVSEMDMDYEIVSEGVDEIGKLSDNVERMRRRMLDHIKSEQEARAANTELITSISHDIRTPLTVLIGYIEMMKDRETDDPLMESYIQATDSTAQRLKQLSDDMFKYSLAFGDTKGMIQLEEYDALTLFDQLLSEHIVLMREMGYDIHTLYTGEKLDEGCVVLTDAQNLMRIVDNIFSNLRKYADPEHPILFTIEARGGMIFFECENKIRPDTDEAESNGVGLKTCQRLASIIAKKFEYSAEGDYFACRLTLEYRKALLIEEDDDFLIGE